MALNSWLQPVQNTRGYLPSRALQSPVCGGGCAHVSFRVRNSGCELEKQIKSVSEDACNISEVSSLEGNLITSVSFDNSGGRTVVLFPAEAGTNHHLPQEWLAFPWERRKTIIEAWQERGRGKWLRHCVFCIVWCKASRCRWSWSS